MVNAKTISIHEMTIQGTNKNLFFYGTKKNIRFDSRWIIA